MAWIFIFLQWLSMKRSFWFGWSPVHHFFLFCTVISSSHLKIIVSNNHFILYTFCGCLFHKFYNCCFYNQVYDLYWVKLLCTIWDKSQYSLFKLYIERPSCFCTSCWKYYLFSYTTALPSLSKTGTNVIQLS